MGPRIHKTHREELQQTCSMYHGQEIHHPVQVTEHMDVHATSASSSLKVMIEKLKPRTEIVINNINICK